MIKFLLASIAVLLSLILVQGIEHSHLSRGITCELYYIQGQVDTAKSLDLLSEKFKEKKNDWGVDFIKRIQNYQLFVANLEGIQKCVTIERGLLEILYYRTKNLF